MQIIIKFNNFLLETLRPKWDIVLKTLPSCLRELAEHEVEGMQKSEGMDNNREREPFRPNRTDTCLNSQTLWLPAQGLPNFILDRVLTLRREVDSNYLQLIAFWKKKNILSNEGSQDVDTQSKVGLMTTTIYPTKNKFIL